jgi:hypothetical protein
MPGGQSTSCKSTNKDKPKPVNTVHTIISKSGQGKRQ